MAVVGTCSSREEEVSALVVVESGSNREEEVSA